MSKWIYMAISLVCPPQNKAAIVRPFSFYSYCVKIELGQHECTIMKKYKPRLDLKQIKSFTLDTRFDYAAGTRFTLFVEDDDYFAIPEGRTKSVNARWIDTAFTKKKIGSIEIYAAT